MAEQVQAVLDQMVAPLRDLMDRHIFSETEIRMIVARRRDSEYLLRRRTARKADFLRYIEAEMNLEKLRELRTKQVLLRQKEERKKTNDSKQEEKSDSKKQHLGDTHIVQHIHFLFTRVIRKYRSDVSLYLQHAEFCKRAKSYTRLSRIYAEALQVHPRNVGLWIEASSLEFFGIPRDGTETVGGGAVQPARVLLQRGLRINATARELWLQYFCMELHHLQKLRGRREILQLVDDKINAEEGEETTSSIFQDAMIPMVVFNNAIKAVSDDVTFRLNFLDLCNGFPETEKLEAHIVESVARDFEDQAEAWIARAAFAANSDRGATKAVGFIAIALEDEDNGEEQQDDAEVSRKRQRLEVSFKDPVLSVLSRAVEKLPSNDMYLLAIRFLRSSYLLQLTEEGDTEKHAAATQVLGRLLEQDEVTSPEVVLEQSDYLSEQGKSAEALAVLKNYAQGNEKIDLAVWLEWVRMSHESMAVPTAEHILRKGLNRIPMQDKAHMTFLLELLGLLLLSVEKEITDDTRAEEAYRRHDFLDPFQRILLLSGGRDVAEPDSCVFGIPSVAVACLRCVMYSIDSNDLKTTRKVCDVVLRSTYVSKGSGKSPAHLDAMKGFFDACIAVEKSEMKRQDPKRKQTRQRLRLLYDAAIHFFLEVAPSVSDEYATRRDSDVRYS